MKQSLYSHSMFSLVLNVGMVCSESLVAAVSDREELEEELDRLSVRHDKLIQDSSVKETQWRERWVYKALRLLHVYKMAHSIPVELKKSVLLLLPKSKAITTTSKLLHKKMSH